MSPGTIDRYLCEVVRAVDAVDRRQIEAVARVLMSTWSSDATVYTMGNGGSASLASHMACDLGKNTAPDLGGGPGQPAGRRLRVIALTDNAALLTALGNDIDYRDVFVEQLKNLLGPQDVVVAISGSGRSPNIVRGLEFARMTGATTIGLTGSRQTSAEMLALTDYPVVVPTQVMEQIEDLHVMVNHVLTVYLRDLIARTVAVR